MQQKLLFLSPLCLILACGTHREATEVAKAMVQVAQPTHVQEMERIGVSGTLIPQSASSMVAFQVPGRAVKVMQREGDPVRKGQVLAELDAVNLTHALEAAHAQVETARAGAIQADQEFVRMKQLFESQSLAPNDFAKFTAARDASHQQLQQAIAGEGVARKNHTEARLVAPINGFVVRRMVEPGVMVGAGQPVFEIAALDPIEVNVGVPETDVNQIKVGQSASLTVPALPGQIFQGTVKLVNVSADPATRTYMARILVPNHDRVLKAGMVAEVSITGTRKLDMLLVPTEAIVRDPQGATQVFQYFSDQQRVYSKRVEVGSVYGRSIQVRSGLIGNESIVVAGQNSLRNGMGAEAVQGRK